MPLENAPAHFKFHPNSADQRVILPKEYVLRQLSFVCSATFIVYGVIKDGQAAPPMGSGMCRRLASLV